MKSIAKVLPSLLLWGCASGGPPPVSIPAPPAAPVAPAQPQPEPSPAPTAQVELPTSCDQVLEMQIAGDHKPAVDAMQLLRDHEIVCSPETDVAFEASRETLQAADLLVRTGLDQRDRGDMAAARTSFEQALALYPKYYWVKALENTLSKGRSEAAVALREKAADLRSEGRIEEALAVLEEVSSQLPSETETLEALSEVRTQVAFRHLAAANKAVADGRLEHAAQSVLEAIGTRPDLEPARHRVIEDARNIGLSLFSAGELIQAREVWRAALELDQSNDTLLEYLMEVDARLESLEAIKDKSD